MAQTTKEYTSISLAEGGSRVALVRVPVLTNSIALPKRVELIWEAAATKKKDRATPKMNWKDDQKEKEKAFARDAKKRKANVLQSDEI